jgi:glycosyltransferase involved in cell wall biosynthesis
MVKLLPRWLAWRVGLGSAYGVEQVTFGLRLLLRLWADRIDVLHVQDPMVAVIVQRARRLGLVRTKVILAHGTEEKTEFLSKCDHVQHLAPAHAEVCRDAWRPGWTVIPNFIDTERFAAGAWSGIREELGIPGDAVVVLTVAAIKRRHKRIDYLLAEFERLVRARPDLPTWLVVAGSREAETEEVIAEGRRLLGDRVRFLVQFPRERMPELYRNADLFVLPSLKEMMPIAVLEAMASGLPCVVNDDPVLRWMVGDGGRCIDAASPGALCGALGALVDDAAERRRIGNAARRRCVEEFGEEAVVGRILGHYDEVAGGVGANATRRPRVAEGRPRVSVVIPAYNCEQWVSEAVASVLGQTVPPDEVFVVDDGSTDDTRARLAPFMERIRYEQQSNQGVAEARNRGVAVATGDLIAFLDADDAWHPRKLEVQLAALREHPEIGLLASESFDWPGEWDDEVHGGPRIVPWAKLVVRNRIATSSVIVRRKVLEEAGPFDPMLLGPEDIDLWLRIAERTTVAVLPARLVGYRDVAGSLGRRAETMEQGLRRILGKLDARGSFEGRWLLRRKAQSYTGYSCAYMYGAAGEPLRALTRLVESFIRYPLPYQAAEVRRPLARPRLLAAMLVRWVRGERPGVGRP